MQSRDQPFLFNGSYSIEGCFRSCFQEKMVEKCGCADPRFPYTESGMFCTQTNSTNRESDLCLMKFSSDECNQNYIETYGDYYFVNCTCFNPCNETVFTADIWRTIWPSGTFFYEQYCPSAELSGLDCRKYYRWGFRLLISSLSFLETIPPRSSSITVA
jgi:hypothetical protein